VSAEQQGCGAPAGGVAVTENSSGEAIIEGTVTSGGAPVQVGYARLLNDDGEFVAEVPLGEDGGFRFFAAPGSWTVRVLAPRGAGWPLPHDTPRGQAGSLPPGPFCAPGEPGARRRGSFHNSSPVRRDAIHLPSNFPLPWPPITERAGAESRVREFRRRMTLRGETVITSSYLTKATKTSQSPLPLVLPVIAPGRVVVAISRRHAK